MNRQTRAVMFLVLVLVNGAAIWGQTGWALDHIVPVGWTFATALTLSLGFAAALELTGVVLALLADAAEENGGNAAGIRFGSYAMGVASGALNLSHWGLNAAGIAFAFLSALSPFLWGIRARVRRGAPAAPSRRFWHPRRSITLIRYMAWEGIATEEEALSHWVDAPVENGSPEISDEEMTEIMERWTEKTEEPFQYTNEIFGERVELSAPEMPAIERRERAPRGEISPALKEAISALISGEKPVNGPGASAPVVARYAKVLRALREDPNALIDRKAEKVHQELVDVLRSHAREVAPR